MIETIIIGLLILFILVIMYMFVQDIFLISLIFFIFAFAVYLGLKWYFKRKKKPVVQAEPEEQETMLKETKESIELKDFVKYNIHYGQTPKIIRDSLEKEGWPKEKIDKAFLDYYAEAKI